MNYKYCPHCGECLEEDKSGQVTEPELLEKRARENHEIDERYREKHWKKKGWKNFKPRPFDKEKFLDENK